MGIDKLEALEHEKEEIQKLTQEEVDAMSKEFEAAEQEDSQELDEEQILK